MDKYNSKMAGFMGWLNEAPHGYAITINSACTLYSVPKEQVNKQWRLHEDCHKAQIIRLGWWGFMLSYFWELITVGYQNNKYEVEARLASKHIN